MSKVIGKKILDDYTDEVTKHLKPEIYVTVQGTGDDSFAVVNDTKADAVMNGESDEAEGELVCTYKLVRVEVLKVKHTTEVVTA